MTILGNSVSFASINAATIYVSATSGDDGNSGASWTLAKQTIQAGVDVTGDTVLVTNGIYNMGSRIPPGQLLCQTRLVIYKAVREWAIRHIYCWPRSS